DIAGTARERLVGAAVRAATRLVGDPLLTSVLDRDAELLLPYLVERIGGVNDGRWQLLASRILGVVAGVFGSPPAGRRHNGVVGLASRTIPVTHKPAEFAGAVRSVRVAGTCGVGGVG
ncbi:MAG TPA: hypothetical protein VH352_10595, partial [Pseudonocardiaceae bacterium]|nr:hypothetical protein [Pseudonocardiaceae bacterium]